MTLTIILIGIAVPLAAWIWWPRKHETVVKKTVCDYCATSTASVGCDMFDYPCDLPGCPWRRQ